jgi:hypothetical protein
LSAYDCIGITLVPKTSVAVIIATNKMFLVLFIGEINDLLSYIKGQSVKKEFLFLN